MNRMKFAAGLALAIMLAGTGVWAQSSSESTGGQTHSEGKGEAEVVRTFYIQSATDSNGLIELLTGIRTIVTPTTKIFLDTEQRTIIARTTPDQIAVIEKLLHDLDRPIKTYRLSYTFTETDGGNTIGVQHYSMVVASGKKAEMKRGSKVPVATGSFGADTSKGDPKADGSDVTTQFTYLDVGINLSATVEESPDGLTLQSKAEQLSVAEERNVAFPQDPVIRQALLAGTAHLTLGKAVILGSIDTPGSTRHFEVQVVAELVR